ncbi:acyltransferase [Brachybacterium sp. Marseille-Q7125]|uniref:acyltransferase family protein n=1 Tax=Brachybacterium sp. Marseille-Q7125 TaxID=2932815 RepID=UPI001FF14C03|nr:acyltransferase [Brachybacterium sp. Marseille-Q7125]
MTGKSFPWLHCLHHPRGDPFLLLSHASTIPGITAAIATPEAVHLLNAFLSPFRMPVLMVLSGALLARSLGRPLGTYIWGKARVLVWSYLVWAIVIFAVLGRLSELLRPWEWVQTLYLWYLAFLFVYYLIALLVPRIGAMPVLLTAVGMAAVADAAQRGFITSFFFYMTLFFLGHLLAPRLASLSRHRVLLLGVVLIAFAVTAQLLQMGLHLDDGVLWRLVRVIPAAVGTSALAQGLLPTGCPVPRALAPVEWVGRSSLVFYVSHYPVMALLAQAVSRSGIALDGMGIVVVGFSLALIGGGVLVLLRRRVSPVDLLFELPRRGRAVR